MTGKHKICQTFGLTIAIIFAIFAITAVIAAILCGISGRYYTMSSQIVLQPLTPF